MVSHCTAILILVAVRAFCRRLDVLAPLAALSEIVSQKYRIGVSYPGHAVSYVTLCIPPSSRTVEKYPPFWSPLLAWPRPASVTQMRLFCASDLPHIADEPVRRPPDLALPVPYLSRHVALVFAIALRALVLFEVGTGSAR